MDLAQKEWIETNGQTQIKNIAQHYGIYEHLFGRAHFLPRIPLNIKVSESFNVKELPEFNRMIFVC